MLLFFTVIFITITASFGYDASQINPIRRAVAPAQSRIINGKEAIPHSYKYQVGIWINDVSFCGGVLLSPNVVLTAAHCGIEVHSKLDVTLGAHNISNSLEPNKITVPGTKVIMHANYNSTSFENDICLIILGKSVTFNQYIQPVQLPKKSDSNLTYVGESAIALGWGLVHDVSFPSTKDLSNVLMEVSLSVMNLAECGAYYNIPAVKYVNSGNICTSGYRNRGTCVGDSGGPLILKNILIGLTSFGNDKCEACSPSVFTRVVKYLDWIAVNSDVKIEP